MDTECAMKRSILCLFIALLLPDIAAAAASCDKVCLEEIAAKYRAAYVKHDVLSASERVPREEMIRQADAYFRPWRGMMEPCEAA
jgi:hypothetical protein